ncbi:hypothetical protein BEUL_0093 [Bifidobacterium eulemuris]|uniref:Potassium-transporting ATPase subunit F n=1 Tax=Bifidobacterium eulemuris TaxID=1765219 RepID=A0A261GFZ1_9BIFI|nr:hypothetical protein BEUL_0093 [Bifidobacterium eulemuris]
MILTVFTAVGVVGGVLGIAYMLYALCRPERF